MALVLEAISPIHSLNWCFYRVFSQETKPTNYKMKHEHEMFDLNQKQRFQECKKGQRYKTVYDISKQSDL